MSSGLPPEGTKALLKANEKGWHPRLYEGWFRLNPFQALLRRREQAAVLAAVQRRIAPGDSVLELGPGTGHYTLPLARTGARVLAVDSSPEMLRFLERRLTRHGLTTVSLRHGSLGLPLDLGERFDGVVSVGLLNYVPNLAGALETVAAHLRSEGWAVLTVPLANLNGRIYQLGERLSGRRVWIYSREEFRATALQAGLHVERDVAAGVSRRGLTLVAELTRLR